MNVQLPEEVVQKVLNYLNEQRPKTVLETAVLIQEIQRNTKPVVVEKKKEKQTKKETKAETKKDTKEE